MRDTNASARHGFVRHGSPAQRALLALGLGLGLAVAAAFWQQLDNQRRLEQLFDQRVQALADELVNRVSTYEYGLRGARGAVLAVGFEGLRRERFHVYHRSRALNEEFPGAHGFGIIRRVPPGQTEAFVAATRADGAASFALQQLNAHDGDRYIIQYIEPEPPNRLALGLDIASEPLRRDAAIRAMLDNRAAITAPITLVQAAGKPRQGFLVLLPIYRPGLPIESTEEREAATDGWAYTPLVIEDVLRDLLPHLTELSLALVDQVHDPMPGQASAPFYGPVGGAQPPGTPGAEAVPAAAGLQRQLQRKVYGRQWSMTLRAAPLFVASQRLLQPGAVLAAGTLAALLAAALLNAYLLVRQRSDLAREGQRRLATIVDNASDAIVSTRLDGRISSWNRAAERIFGHHAAQALGQPMDALLLVPASHAAEREAMLGLRAGQAMPLRKLTGLHRDGHHVPLAVSSSAILGSASRVVGIGHTLRDISDRQRAEQQLREFNHHLERQVGERTAQLETARHDLQTMLDAMPSMVAYWDRDLVNRFANRAYRERFGPGRPGPSGQRIDQWMPDDMLARLRPPLQAALAGQDAHFEISLAATDDHDPDHEPGQRHWLTHCLPDRLDGQVRGVYELVQDVTEITESRRRLSDGEAFLERAGRVAGVGAWQLDLATGAITWSAQTRRIHEVDDEVAVQLIDGLSFYPAQARPVIERAVQQAMDLGQGWDLELPFVTARGRAIWVRTVGEAERALDDQGQPAGPVLRLVGAFQDISQRRQADDALRRLDAALAANAAKSDFLATMSHEIRTPMNAVLGISYLLQHTRLDAAQQDLLGKLQLSGRLLLSVINDVLDLSRIEAGELVLERAPLSLASLVNEVVDMLRAGAQSKGLALQVELPADLPDPLLGDALRLRQVLSNLVANALKFTEQGQVTVRLTWADGRGDSAGSDAADQAGAAPPVGLQIGLEVSDTGIGMSPALQARVFSPFTQGDASITRRFGGSGLGLSIVYRLVKLMAGAVEVHSVPGQGSRFVVSLNLQQPGPAELADGPDALRLLVVSADAAQAARLAAVADGLGWQAEVLAADRALDQALAQRSARGLPTHVLLADEQLLAAQQVVLDLLRQASAEADWPALVVMTDVPAGGPAGPMNDASSAAPRLGPRADSSALFNAVSTAMASGPGGHDRLAASTRLDKVHCRWLPEMRVMVVDDSEINREVACRILQREGALVTLCRDGHEAVNALREQPASQDLVLMDVQMPDLDGYSATRTIRALPGLAELPVVALSAGALEQERARAIASGMNDFVAKPLEPAMLIRTLRRQLHRVQGRPWPVLPGLMPEPAPAASASLVDDWPLIEGLDAVQSGVRMGGDRRLLASTLHRLLAEHADLAELRTLPEPLTPVARDVLLMRLHKLRGGAGLVAAHGLVWHATAAETALRALDDAGAAVALQRLAMALSELARAAAPWLARREADLPVGPLPPPLPPPPLSTPAAQALVDLLQRHDLSALTELQRADTALRGQLGPLRHRALHEALDQLQFDQAARLLQDALFSR